MNRIETPPRMILLHQKRLSSQAREIASDLGPWASTCPVGLKFRWLQNVWDFIPFPDISLFTGDYDLFHSFHHFIPPARGRPAILTVHDLRRYVLPELYPASRTDRFEKAVQRADHFIAVSEATGDDLRRIFNIPAEKIDVVHLACGISPEDMDRLDRKTMKKRLLTDLGTDATDYLLAISSKDSRKNIPRIIQAFNTAADQIGGNTALVITGRLPENLTLPESGRFFNPGEVDNIMPWLACSSGLIFTSLYEGFGLPVLEGFAASIPVITSNRSSMPEVAGDAALLVNPAKTRDIAGAISLILSNRDIVKGKIAAGRKRLRQFSWESSAEKTALIYKKIIRVWRRA